ncbi:MAG: TIR domain-containing protein [Chloroflexota bacterium]|nr:TIR domain-containing protein [Chloroflexota bacterium]
MKFDVFLSHNSKDKPIVEQIAHKLEAKGLKVWLDKWNLVPGDPWQEDLEDALDESQTITVFVGPHTISPWENEEMRSAIEERVQDKKRRVIPVLLPGAPDNKTLKLPRFLKRLTWVDFRTGLNDEEALYRLECGVKGISPGKSSLTPAPLPIGEGYAPPPVGDLPIGSYLPFPPNPLFEGRVNDLKKLAESLVSNSNTGMIVNQKAITGMGGLGKTQLAVEFAYRYGRYYRGVHWLNLADPSLLDSEIAQCGKQMALANWLEDQPSQVVLTLNTWKADGPRLLVLDNFEAVEQINSVLTRLRHSSLRLLITSRRADWPKTAG